MCTFVYQIHFDCPTLSEHPTPPPGRAPLPSSRLAPDQIHVVVAVLYHLGHFLLGSQSHRHIFLIPTRNGLAFRFDHFGVLEEYLLEIVVDVLLDDNVFGVVLGTQISTES
jgi:hypothetical protein